MARTASQHVLRSAAGLIAIDGPYDDIRDVEGYRERMTENRAKGMTGVWSLTPGQIVTSNKAPLPPKTGRWLLEVNDSEIDISKDRMWDEATYQAAQTPITLFQDVYEHRPDQHEAVTEMYRMSSNAR